MANPLASIFGGMAKGNSNPINMLKMFLGNNGNPKDLVLQAIQMSGNNNPEIQNLINMASNGNIKGVEEYAKNYFQKNGMDFNNEFSSFMKNFKQ